MTILCEVLPFPSFSLSLFHSTQLDSQIRPHNNNKSGNYCIKCLIYVFSQLFYLWACTPHCSSPRLLSRNQTSLGNSTELRPGVAKVNNWTLFVRPENYYTTSLFLFRFLQFAKIFYMCVLGYKKLRNLFSILFKFSAHFRRE